MARGRGAALGLRRAIGRFPPVRAWRERSYERLFSSDEFFGTFRGIFSTFDEALRSAPPNRARGFDHADYAKQFRERMQGIYSYDYPVLFWLAPTLRPGMRVFDYGGHVGVQFYSYQRYLKFPQPLRWLVCDVPAVVEAGRAIAREQGVDDRLAFTTEVPDADGADVFICAGALQFVERPLLHETLERLKKPPTHLLLNKLPLRDGAAFVTLQNAGPVYVAQHVFDRRAFLSSLDRAGYELIDQWEDRVHSCRIPFHPERDVVHYSGLYLRRRAA
jgi:putative methyltransferase (TIGR04325 family)